MRTWRFWTSPIIYPTGTCSSLLSLRRSFCYFRINLFSFMSFPEIWNRGGESKHISDKLPLSCQHHEKGFSWANLNFFLDSQHRCRVNVSCFKTWHCFDKCAPGIIYMYCIYNTSYFPYLLSISHISVQLIQPEIWIIHLIVNGYILKIDPLPLRYFLEPHGNSKVYLDW